LYDKEIVRRDTALAWPGAASPPGFRVADGVYLYEADVVRQDGEGTLEVTVGAVPAGTEASCAVPGKRYELCEVVTRYGTPVVQALWKSATGEKRNLALAVLPDGTKVAAASSNLSRRAADQGRTPDGAAPVLDLETLSKLVLKSGFHAG
jgi:hypothetical protein